jgi:hypothetical protein
MTGIFLVWKASSILESHLFCTTSWAINWKVAFFRRDNVSGCIRSRSLASIVLRYNSGQSGPRSALYP